VGEGEKYGQKVEGAENLRKRGVKVREEVSQRAYSQTRLCVQRDKTDKKVNGLWDYKTIIRLFFSYFFHISIRDPENERRKLDSMKVGASCPIFISGSSHKFVLLPATGNQCVTVWQIVNFSSVNQLAWSQPASPPSLGSQFN